MNESSLAEPSSRVFLSSDENDREDLEVLISQWKEQSPAPTGGKWRPKEDSHERTGPAEDADRISMPVHDQVQQELTPVKRKKGKPFPCPQCPASFDKKTTLKQHLLDHENEKPLKCDECGDTFLVAENLEVHRFVHEIEKGDDSTLTAEERAKCIRCGAKFKRIAGMKSHLAMKHFVEEICKCEVCEKEFVLPGELKVHREKHLKEAKQRTSPLLPVNQDLPREVSQARKKFQELIAKRKKKKTKSKRGKKKAKLVVERGAKHICQYCGKDFQKAAVLDRHLRVHTKEKPFKCDQCNQVFSQKSSLKRHIELHKGEKKFSCLFCSFKAAFKKNVELHIRRLHWHKIGVTKLGLLPTQDPNSLPQLKCPHCECLFQRLSCLSAHQKKVHGDINFLRPSDEEEDDKDKERRRKTDDLEKALVNCGLDPSFLKPGSDQQLVLETKNTDGTVEVLTFNLPRGLEARESVDDRLGAQMPNASTSAGGLASDRPHICRECGAGFKKADHLEDHVNQMHKKILSEEFACRVCGKMFCSRTAMASHMQNHGPEDGYKCNECPKTFKFRNAFKRHLLIHSKNQPVFACPYCSRAFRSRSNCEKHAKTRCQKAPHYKECAPRYKPPEVTSQLLTTFTPGGDELVLLSAGNEEDEPVFLFLPHGEENRTIVVSRPPEVERRHVVVVNNGADIAHHPMVLPSGAPSADPQNAVIDLNRCFVLPNGEGGVTLVVPQPEVVLDDDVQPVMEAPQEDVKMGAVMVVNGVQEMEDPPIIVEEGLERIVEQHGDQIVVVDASGGPSQVLQPIEERPHESIPEPVSTKPSSTHFTCDHCSRQFKKKSDFNRHQKVHTGEKPFQCTVCQKRFATSYNLTSHMEVHSVERTKISCPECGKPFATRSSLNLHMRLHEGTMPFECHVCKDRFRTSGHLSSHLRTRHAKEDPNFDVVLIVAEKTRKLALSLRKLGERPPLPPPPPSPSPPPPPPPPLPPSAYQLFSRLTDQNRPPSEVLVGTVGDVGDIGSSIVPSQPSDLDLDSLVNFHPSDDLDLENPVFSFVSVP